MRLFVIVSCAAAMFGALAWPLITRTVPVESDLGRYHLPLRDFYRKCIRAGHDPAWCPHLFCGYDCHGEGQAGMDHPWHALLYRLPVRLETAFNLEIFANYPVLFLGMALFLRRHGLSRDAALAGAIAATFSGFTLPHWPHTNSIAVVSHIPWLLWLTDVWWSGTSAGCRAWAALGIAGLTGSQILLGYPQYVYFSGFAEGIYALCLLPRGGRPLPGWVLWKALGVAIGAAQLLPSLEAVALSPRLGYDASFRGMLSLPPVMLLQLVAPYSFNTFTQLHEYAAYGGVLATLGTIWWLTAGRWRWPTAILDRWALILILVSVPLALGKYTPLFQVYLKLPVVGLFRCPCRYLVLTHLAAAVVVARLVDSLIEGPARSWRQLAWLAPAPVLSWAMAGGGWVALAPLDTRVFLEPATWLGPLAMTLAAGLLALAGRGRRWAVPLLLLIGFADQAAWGFRAIRVYTFVDIPTLIEREAKPPGEPIGRIVADDVRGNTLMMAGWSYTNGYVGLTPPRTLDYSRDEVQRWAGTRWRERAGAWEPVDGAPRVRWADRADLPGQIVEEPGRIVIATGPGSGGELIIAESWHPGWEVSVDGVPAELDRFQSDFLKVAVPAGEHVIEFHFSARRRTIGRRVSLVGLLAAVVLAAFVGRTGRAIS